MHRRRMLLSLSAAALCVAAPPVCAAKDFPDLRYVALTFDDGPHPTLTPMLLDMLERERVRATFYLIGSSAAASPDIVRRAFAAGHEIGNHSWSHPDLTRIPLARAAEEIARTDAQLESITGEIPNTVRPPYGALNSQVEALAEPRPMMLWDVDTNDWRTRNTASVEHAAIRSDGGIVLMHDIHPTTVAAVPAIIRDFKSRGFRFVTVSDCVEWDIRNIADWLDLA
jgi:peptidoglycan/xylan/chitin deacetylase (PgdA/CDA1 family)